MNDSAVRLEPAEAIGCPRCNAPLRVERTSAACTECVAKYPVADGVLCTDRTGVFMGEFDAVRMRDYTARARELGWRHVVETEMIRADAGSATVLLRPERATFLDILGAHGGESVLDLGAGMGAISLRLAKRFRHVYALDQTFERMAFLRVVADQEDVEAIVTICHRDVHHLPFRSGALDAAIMVGVFEYFPASYPHDSIVDVQLRSLRELYRILTPGGVLFIATKNRFGWSYWGGATDNSGLPFGSLLPRWLANSASRATLGRPYRIVTDSRRRYEVLLAQAGFTDARFYWPAGGYQAPLSWIDLEDKAAVRAGIERLPASASKKRLFTLLADAGVLGHAVPHFGIVARKAA